MKALLYISMVIVFLAGCKTANRTFADSNTSNTAGDTIRIANEELQYEIIIIDPGFTSWLNSRAKPREFYSQSFLEMRNSAWVREWNSRFLRADRNSIQLYEMQINYDFSTDYGYEVNYLLYNYLTYFQIKNNVQLGGFVPKI